MRKSVLVTGLFINSDMDSTIICEQWICVYVGGETHISIDLHVGYLNNYCKK